MLLSKSQISFLLKNKQNRYLIYISSIVPWPCKTHKWEHHNSPSYSPQLSIWANYHRRKQYVSKNNATIGCTDGLRSLTVVGLHPEPKGVNNAHSMQRGGLLIWEIIKQFPKQQVLPQAYPTPRNINWVLPSPIWSQFLNWQRKVSKKFSTSLHHTLPLFFQKDIGLQVCVGGIWRISSHSPLAFVALWRSRH